MWSHERELCHLSLRLLAISLPAFKGSGWLLGSHHVIALVVGLFLLLLTLTKRWFGIQVTHLFLTKKQVGDLFPTNTGSRWGCFIGEKASIRRCTVVHSPTTWPTRDITWASFHFSFFFNWQLYFVIIIYFGSEKEKIDVCCNIIRG